MNRGQEELLVHCLASGLSYRKAARKANCGYRTVYNRMHEPEFVGKVDEARSGLIARMTGALAEAALPAVNRLRKILKEDAEKSRDHISAAGTVLRSALAAHDLVTLEKKLDAFTAALARFNAYLEAQQARQFERLHG